MKLSSVGLAAVSLVAALAAAPASAVELVGLTTTNALVRFDSATPGQGTPLVGISGLQGADERIVAIDRRPTTGLLYGVSSDDKVYSLALDGSASFVAALSAPLSGDIVGIDFNPVADLSGATSLRIVSSTGQNFAFNVATGATVVQTPIQSGITAVAYANNDVDAATGTALYYVDAGTDTLRRAAGAFNNPTITTVGALGANVNGVNGFEIVGAGLAFAAMTDADTGKSGLYTLDLGTGLASFVGAFGIGGNTAISPPLLGLSAAPIPEPSTYALMLAGLAGIGWVSRRKARPVR